MLNTKQERAIFLLTAGISPITIAQELEITNEILHGWLQQPYFVTALHNHKQACREANRNRLEYLFGRALNALDEVLKTGNASEKLQAVQLLFERFEAVPAQLDLHSQTEAETQSSPPTEAQELIEETTDDMMDDAFDTEPLIIHSPKPTLETVAAAFDFSGVDETILEECLDDLQMFLNGNMSIEKAKARLYPIIEPNRLTMTTANAILPEVIKQVSANHSKSLFVIKT